MTDLDRKCEAGKLLGRCRGCICYTPEPLTRTLIGTSLNDVPAEYLGTVDIDIDSDTSDTFGMSVNDIPTN